MPAPVSPVMAFSPAAGVELGVADQHEVLDAEARQQGLAVPAEERHLGERREQGALGAQPPDDSTVRLDVGDPVPVGEDRDGDVRCPVPDHDVAVARHHERPRV